jgi:hypothetical protein
MIDRPLLRCVSAPSAVRVARWFGPCLLVALAGCSGSVDTPAAGDPDAFEAMAPGTSPDPANPLNTTPGNTPGSRPTPGPPTPVIVNEDGVVIDEEGNPVLDEQGNPVLPPVTDPTQPPSDPAVGSPTNPSTDLADCSTPGPRQIRRLTANQYTSTLQSLFQDPTVPEEAVLSDPSALGFHVDAKAAVVRDLEGELLMGYAEQVAAWAVDNGKLSQYFTCTELTEQCERDFISNFGAKAHREPLSEEYVSAYRALFDAESSFQDGAEVVVSAMLQSPYLLYRREMGVQSGDEYTLTPYEVASQLSYWLTDAPPDAELYDAARNNRLTTTEDTLREATRLLETQAAREVLARFVEGWLQIDKLPGKAKDESIMPLPTELRDSMLGETRELFLGTFYEGGSLSDLFSAEHTYLDQRLSTLYGFGNAGESFQRAELTGTNRPMGVLGQAAFLSTHALSDNSSPVQRAKVVIERLLCRTLPPVPANLNTTLDPQTEFTTNRERYEVHREREECRVCHEDMDPIGFAFEHYDGFGRYRDQENGVDVDATGSLAQLASGAIALDGVDSLSRALADSPELQSCLVRYWSYYTFGAEDWASQECHQDGVVRSARAADFTLKSVVLGIAESPHFSRRVNDP